MVVANAALVPDRVARASSAVLGLDLPSRSFDDPDPPVLGVAVIYLASLAGLAMGFAVAPGHTLKGPAFIVAVLSFLASGIVLAIGAL